MTYKHGGFFGIEREAWQHALALGLNPAVGFLVLARFTADDQRTTPAGVNAIERYTAISRPRARAAIDALLAAGLTREIQRRGPTYYDIGIGPKPAPDPDGVFESQDLIWLRNEIVTGAGREVPPLERIRQCQDPAVLHLFISLYDCQNMADSSGIDRKILWQNSTARKFLSTGSTSSFDSPPTKLSLLLPALLRCRS